MARKLTCSHKSRSTLPPGNRSESYPNWQARGKLIQQFALLFQLRIIPLPLSCPPLGPNSCPDRSPPVIAFVDGQRTR